MSTDTKDTCHMRVARGWSKESATGTAFVCALKENRAMAKDCKAWREGRNPSPQRQRSDNWSLIMI